MPTVADPKPTGPARVDTRLDRDLAQVAARIRLNDVFAGAAALAVLTLGYGLAVILLDRTFDLPLWSRQLGLAAFLLAFSAVGYFAVLRPFRRSVNPRYAARQLEGTVPGAKNAVINWVDLKDRDLPDPVRNAVGLKAADGVADADVYKATESRATLWLAGTAGVLLALLLAQVVICKPAQFFSLLGRTFTPFSLVRIASRTQIGLHTPAGGNAIVTAGDPLTVAVSVGGRLPDPDSPERVRLQFRHNPAAEEFDELPLEPGATDHDWTLRVPDHVVQNGFWYRVAAGDATTPEYRVEVRSRPVVKGFVAKYEYPAYLRMKPETGREPRLEAFRGTKVTLTVETNRRLASGRLTVAGQQPLVGKVTGEGRESLEFKLTLAQDSTYQIAFAAESGEQSPPGPAYPIKVIPDNPPTVQVTAPAEDALTLPANGLLKIDAAAGDDFGLDALTLRLRAVVGDKTVSLKSRPYQDGRSFKRDADGSHPTSLEYKDSVPLADLATVAGPAGLEPGNVVEFWLEATDNCAEPAPNIGKSRVVRVTLGPPVVEPEKKDLQKQDAAARKAEEQQHAKQQDAKLNGEQRDAPQLRPDGDQPPAGENPPAKPPEAADPPKAADPGQKGNDPPQAAPNDAAKPMTDPAAKPEDGQPMKGADGQPGANATDDQKIQDQAKQVQQELEKQQQAGEGRGGEKPEPGKGNEAPPADPKKGEQPNAGDGAAEPKPGEKGDGGEPKPGDAGGSKGEGNLEPPANPADEKPEPKPAGDPMQSENGASGSTPKNESKAGNPGSEKPGEPEKKPADPKAPPESQPKPEDGGSGRGGDGSDPKSAEPNAGGKPGESKDKPEPGRAAEKPSEQPGGEGDSPKPSERPSATKGDKPTPGGQSKPQPMGEPEPGKPEPSDEKPAGKPNGDPMAGEQQPGSTKSGGQPQPGGGQPQPGDSRAKGEEKPSDQWPQKKPEPGELSREIGDKNDPNGVPPPAEDVERLTRDREDLASGDPQKRKDAEEKFDDLLGKKKREELQQSVKDAKNGGDPGKQSAAKEKADELTKKAAKNNANSKPSPEDIERAKERANDLTSDDPQKREAAEKEFDDAIGKDRREQLQQAMKDAKQKNGGDPVQKLAEQKADELTKKAAQNAKGQPSKEDVQKLAEKANDLASDDAQKREAAEKEFDNAVGKENREKLQQAAKDLKSGDPAKQQAAKENLDQMAKDAAKGMAKGGDNRGESKAGGDKPKPGEQNATGGKPNDQPKNPSKEDVEKLAEKAKDLASDDPKNREAAEKEFDNAVGKENREKLQQAANDLKSGDPAKQQAAKEKLDQMAKDAAKEMAKGGEQPKPGEQPKGPSKEDVEKLAEKAKDLASDDPKAREAAEKEFDNAVGRENREKLQQAAKDLKSGDPAKQKAAKEKLDQMAKDTAKAGEQPKGPSKEDLDKLAEKAKDLNSPDRAKREAAEKEFDQLLGKDKREQMQKTLDDLQSGDPQRQQAAQKKLEDMAREAQQNAVPNARDGDPTDQPKLGGTPGQGPDGKPLDADPKNRLRTAERQLQQFEKNRYNTELQKKLGFTPEEYEKFLDGYRDMVNRQREEVETAAKPPEQPRPDGPAALRVGEGGRVEARPGASVDPIGAVGPANAPPGFTDAQKRFAEEAAKLRRQK